MAAFVSLLEPPSDHDGPHTWVCLRGGEVWVGDPAAHGLELGELQFLGLLDGVAWWVGELDEASAVEGLRFAPLRELLGPLDEASWAMAGRGVQLADWVRTHRFCGRCGTPTEAAPGERARRCPACRLQVFPRLAPVVITLITRGDETLLARGVNFPGHMFSCVAGFVEPGETLEAAVRREAREEVGVQLGRISYRSSQPWPFPHSLMIGFQAEWAGGDIVCQASEIAEAHWYRWDELPAIPGPISIARQMIDAWVGGHVAATASS